MILCPTAPAPAIPRESREQCPVVVVVLSVSGFVNIARRLRLSHFLPSLVVLLLFSLFVRLVPFFLSVFSSLQA